MWALKKEGKVIQVLESEQAPDLEDFGAVDGDPTYDIVPVHITELDSDGDLSDDEFSRLAGTRVHKLLNEYFKCMDRSYYQFRISVTCLDSDFRASKEIVLIDEVEEGKSHCAFCGEKTNYFDNSLMIPLCAKDFAAIQSAKGQIITIPETLKDIQKRLDEIERMRA